MTTRQIEIRCDVMADTDEAAAAIAHTMTQAIVAQWSGRVVSATGCVAAKEEPPLLDIDRILYPNQPVPPHVRQEQRVAWNLLRELERAGCTITHVIEDEPHRVRSAKEAMEWIFNLDEAHVQVRSPTDAGRARYYVMFLVRGNAPEELVCDYHVAEGTAFGRVMEAFEAEKYL